MGFGVADICDRHVGRDSDAVISTAKPVGNLAVAASSARRQTFDQNFRRRRYQNNRHVGVGKAHRVNHSARYVGDHRVVGADVVVDRAWQCVAIAMRLPIHRELAVGARQPEGLRAQMLIGLMSRGLARDHAARKDEFVITSEGKSRETYQRILAAAARADHQDQPARSDRAGINMRFGP